jgi:Fe-S cluster assembly protein SufD
VNGKFAEPLSSIGNLPSAVRVSSLSAQISRDPAALQPHLGRYLNIDRDAFSALNTAFLEDGAYVHIRRGSVIHDPICFLYISTSSETPFMSHPRNLVETSERR